MSKNSDKYNSLLLEIREICHPIFVQTQITQLLIEKKRLKKHYASSLKEINDHIRNLEREL